MQPVKEIPKYDPDSPITPFQVKRIMQNCKYNDDIKCEWVQWATEDVNRTSLKSITQAQASMIINAQQGNTPVNETIQNIENWGKFDHKNKQHRAIMAILRTANIVVKNERWGEVPDMDGWFSNFLKSHRCPVNKPLIEMKPTQVSKVIVALEGVSIWKNTIRS